MVSALGFTVLSGDPEKALATPGHVVLTESLAEDTPVRRMSWDDFCFPLRMPLTVGAVVADGRRFALEL